MTENLDSYAKAFAELENNEKDLGTWAKAFSETSSEDDAKKLYIKLRVEQLDASEPQTRAEVNKTKSSTVQGNYTPSNSNTPDTTSSESNAKPNFDLKNMSWPDRIAWLVACCATGGFVADVGTTLAMGMSVDLYKVFTGQLILLYIGFPFAIWRLISVGAFNGLLPDGSRKTEIDSYLNQRIKPADYDPETDVRPPTSNPEDIQLKAKQNKAEGDDKNTSGMLPNKDAGLVVADVGGMKQLQEQKTADRDLLRILGVAAIILVIVVFVLNDEEPDQTRTTNGEYFYQGEYQHAEISPENVYLKRIWDLILDLRNNNEPWQDRALTLMAAAEAWPEIVQYPSYQRLDYNPENIPDSSWMGFIDRRMTWGIREDYLIMMIPNPSVETVSEIVFWTTVANCEATSAQRNYHSAKNLNIEPKSIGVFRFDGIDKFSNGKATCLVVKAILEG